MPSRPKPLPLTAVILGGGKMGGEIAAVLANGGWQVHVFEPVPASAASLPGRTRAVLAACKARKAALPAVHARLDAIPWKGVALVLEAVPENLPLKRRILRAVARVAPAKAILATNSSSLRVAEVCEGLPDGRRVAAMHWMPPVHLVPIVEVVRGPETAPATIRRIDGWLTALGKLPVHLDRDVPGMIVNRLQHAMMREAYDLIDRGIATPESIDRAVQYGFGFRYVAAGPLRQRDLNGLVIHHASAAQIYPTLHVGRRPAKCLDDRVKAGQTGARAGRGFYRWDAASLATFEKDYGRKLAAALALMGRGAPARGSRRR